MTLVRWIIVILIGYALGNISTGLILGKIRGIDIRNQGSGSIGATNAFRALGPGDSLWVFLGDILKGALAAGLGWLLLGRTGAMVGGVFAVLGHNFPIIYGFKGGKGVATSLGVLLMVQPILALFCLVIAAVLIYVTKTASIGSLVGLCIMFFYDLVRSIVTHDGGLFLFALVLVALGVFMHRDNIRRLMTGQERKLDFGH